MHTSQIPSNYITSTRSSVVLVAHVIVPCDQADEAMARLSSGLLQKY